MPIQGIFMETTSMPSLDLSLHISPPSPTPSSAPGTDHDPSPDLLHRIEALKPQTEVCSNLVACTHLSLSSSTVTSDGDGSCRWQGPQHDRCQNSPLESVLDGSWPIKGIPIYNSSSPSFLSADPEMGFNHQMLSSPFSWPSFCSSMPSPPPPTCGYSTNLDTMTSFLHSAGLVPSMGSSYHRMMAPPTRFTGLSSGVIKYNQQYSHHQQHGIGPLDVSQNMMRSRFMQKIPAKRSVRAPRMRWTSTLHARFVHAVELLGGHESMPSLSPSVFLFSFSFFFFFEWEWRLKDQPSAFIQIKSLSLHPAISFVIVAYCLIYSLLNLICRFLLWGIVLV